MPLGAVSAILFDWIRPVIDIAIEPCTSACAKLEDTVNSRFGRIGQQPLRVPSPLSMSKKPQSLID